MSDARLRARAILFDLDGTVADSAPDLAFVLNQQLQVRGRAALPLSATRPHVSQGARGLIRIGFNLRPGDEGYEALRDEFLELYALHLFRETVLFPGIEQLLDRLEQEGIAWGIVTNKMERFAVPLLQALGLDKRCACIVGGDTTAKAKPHPEPLLFCAEQLGVAPSSCAYVGDDERDVQAARAAKMEPVVALYGYLGVDRAPHTWGADLHIEQPLDLLKLLALPLSKG